MPSTDDFFHQLQTANGRLLDLTAAVNQVNATLQYTNLALSQNAKQNDTIICILEHISKNTCELLNQSVVQTRLQTEMQTDVDALEAMYETAHAEAALERERLRALKQQIEKCCPPPQPEVPCKYAPCPAPNTLPEPPKIDVIERAKPATRPAR
jgi:chaperonin cofactor prefoldin